jgi:hypothetical protein
MENLLHYVQAVLSTTSLRWQTLAQALPFDLLARPPARGEWSALGCLQHLVDTERSVFPVRVRYFLAGEDFPAFDPDAEGTPPSTGQPAANLAASLAQEFTNLRADSLALVSTLQEEQLDLRARHAELGPVTLSELLHEWAAHDLMHTVQAEQALMQPFIEGCGPWQVYFAGHDVRR